MSSPIGQPAASGGTARRARGYITSYEEGRVCAADGCETTLSRYNKAVLCWRHAEQRDLAAKRERT